jgi:4-aminobutyrate--pyruvate transaminase
MNTLNQSDRQYALHPFTNLSGHQKDGPFIIEKGDGVYVWDDQGNRLLEGMAGLWCTSLGFSEQRLIDAAARQFAQLPYSYVYPPIYCPRY